MIVFTCIILFSVQFGIKANTLANQYASQVYPFQIIISSSFFRVGHSTGRWSPTPAHKIFLHGGRYRHDKRILGCSWRHYCSTWRRAVASVLPSVRYESKSMESSVWREHRSSQLGMISPDHFVKPGLPGLENFQARAKPGLSGLTLKLP